MQLHYVQIHDNRNLRMDKGTLLPNLTVVSVDKVARSEYQGKNLYYCVFSINPTLSDGDTVYEAYEMVEANSELLHYVGKKVTIVVLSVGKGAKSSWIRLEKSPEQTGHNSNNPKSATDMMYLSRDAFRWSVDLCANGVIPASEISNKAHELANQCIQLAKGLES